VLTLFHFSWYISGYVNLGTDLWDLQTRTAGDYTCETQISKEQNMQFYRSLTQEQITAGAPLLLMKVEMMQQLEEHLRSKVPDDQKSQI
jgi:hypothetical protein